MRVLIEAGIALLIVWLFLNYKKTGSALPIIPAPTAQPFDENPGAPGSAYEGGVSFRSSLGAAGSGCGCSGGSAAGTPGAIRLNAPSIATGPGGINPTLGGGGTTVFWSPTPPAPAPAPVHLIAWGA
jgi:hypothetical protein